MREVIAQRLWIGNASDGRDVRTAVGLGIVAVVSLALEESSTQFPREIAYCRFPLIDGAGNHPDIIRAAVDVVARLIQGELPTLVTCGGGMSRSPAIVAAALAKVDRQSLEASLCKVATGTAHDVSTTLWAEVKAACEPGSA